MQLKITLPAVIAISLFLAGCGGDSKNPYDGTWALVYPSPSNEATSLGIAGATCVNYPGSITITNAEGSSTVTGSCTTAASGVVATPIYYIGVSITAKQDIASKDVLNAIANGVTYTGHCLNNSACSAADAAGDTMSINR